MAIEYFNPTGINTYQNLLQTDGQLIHGVNVVSMPLGGKSKRPGYSSFLGTPDAATINRLFSFPDQNGTTLTLYRASGSSLYYSQQGTGAWTVAGNGTITNGNYVDYTIVNNVLLVGDGAGSTRHTTDGTVFTNTTLAPVAQYLANYQGRAFATDGTSSNLNYSVANDITNWNTLGTSDSSSLVIPGEGAGGKTFVVGDRLVITKTKGKLFNWDGFSLVDMATKYGPSSPRSVADIDDTWFYINGFGNFSFDGANKQLLSNPIQRQFYNRQETGIGTAAWGTAPAEAHIWDYLVAVGTVTDDFTGRQISNAIIKYDFQKNEYLNWSFNDAPTAMHSYVDKTNKRQFIFGNATGQVFQLDRTKTSDNGVSIPTEMIYLFTYATQQSAFTPTSASTVSGSTYEKKWNYIRLFFNPGDEMNIQYAFANGLTYQHLRWSEAINTRNQGSPNDFWQVSDGVVEIRFPLDPSNMPRSRFLFVRIYDDSDSSAWTYLGAQIDAEVQIIK